MKNNEGINEPLKKLCRGGHGLSPRISATTDSNLRENYFIVEPLREPFIAFNWQWFRRKVFSAQIESFISHARDSYVTWIGSCWRTVSCLQVLHVEEIENIYYLVAVI